MIIVLINHLNSRNLRVKTIYILKFNQQMTLSCKQEKLGSFTKTVDEPSKI